VSTRTPQSARSTKKPSAQSGPNRSNRQPPRSATAGSKRSAGAPASRQGRGVTNSSTPWGLLFDGHGHDVLGIACILLAVLVALGVWFGAAGPVGSALDAAARGLVGLFAVVAPVGLAVTGVLLIRGRRQPGAAPTRRSGGARTARSGVADPAEASEPAEEPTDRLPARIAGAVLALIVALLAAHLLAGTDASISQDGLDAYGSAGGLLGAGFGWPVFRLIGPWGAWAVVLTLGLLAAGLLSGRPIRSIVGAAARRVRPAAQACLRWVRGLFVVGAATPPPRVALYDQDAAAETTAPPGSRRRRRTRDDIDPASPQESPASPQATPGAAEPTGSTPAVADDATPPGPPEQLQIGLPPGAGPSNWKLPAATSLSMSERTAIDTEAVEQRGRQLEAALAEHGVETRLVGMVVGPTVTRYELELGVGVKVARVTSLNKDIAYALAAPDVRILAPIPGRQAIGIEVPNARRQVVNLGDILASPEARAAVHPLQVGVGRDITGAAVMMDLAAMPHLLIAGQTGAGKSSCINSIITSIMMRTTPDDVRMILIDPKRVELTQYNRIPHLLTQVVTDPRKASNALNWAVKEMERRYDILERTGARDIGIYNAAFDSGELVAGPGEESDFERLSHILIVIDELNDLMMTAPRDVDDAICRIAQKARAVGIHLVIATQRPSVNVITGTIKANVPARLAFAVASAVDSKVILDQPGAERLVGKGDMLLLTQGSSVPHRIQGAWVDEKEVARIAAFWRRQTPAVAAVLDDVQSEQNTSLPGTGSDGGSDDDALLEQAMDLVVGDQIGSTSMLQRRLKVGFARAGRLMDLLEERGVVGPSEGSKARVVLITPDELAAMRASTGAPTPGTGDPTGAIAGDPTGAIAGDPWADATDAHTGAIAGDPWADATDAPAAGPPGVTGDTRSTT